MKIDIASLTDLKNWLRSSDEDASLNTLLTVEDSAACILSDIADETDCAYNKASRAFGALDACKNSESERAAEHAAKMRNLLAIALDAKESLTKDRKRVRSMPKNERAGFKLHDCCAVSPTQQLVTELENLGRKPKLFS